MFCRIKHENIPSWAKRKERNINSSFWPMQTKKENAKGPLNRQTWAEHRCSRNLGPLRNRPGEGDGERVGLLCGRTASSFVWPHLALAVRQCHVEAIEHGFLIYLPPNRPTWAIKGGVELLPHKNTPRRRATPQEHHSKGPRP